MQYIFKVILKWTQLCQGITAGQCSKSKIYCTFTIKLHYNKDPNMKIV